MIHAPPLVTVNELCDRAQAWAETYYCLPDREGHRRPTGEAKNIRDALRAMRAVAGSKPAEELAAEDLFACQQWMVEQGLSRKVINARTNRIRRVIKWATKPPHRLLPPATLLDMQLVEAIKWGRSTAPDHGDVQPVSQELVTATMAVASPTLYAMLDLNWCTGMRPGELVGIRKSELTIERPRLASGKQIEVMVYRPAVSKIRHRGLDRNVFLGPEARRVVEDFARRTKDDRLFNYTVGSYRQLVERANRKHKIPHWTPAQIRHSFATRMRQTAGIDVVQVLMGHRHRSTTEIYALPDCAAAIEAIFRFG